MRMCPQTKFLRDLGGILRASVSVARDAQGQEMIYPWQGSDTDPTIVNNNMKRVKRFLASMLGYEEDVPAPVRNRRGIRTG